MKYLNNEELKNKIKELKAEEYVKYYDSKSIEFSSSVPSAKDVDKPIWYLHKWTMKHIPEDSKVLDVGCGGGHLCRLLRDRGNIVMGLDVSKVMIDKLTKELPDIPFFQGIAEDLPFQNNDFDVVVCNQLLEHLKSPTHAIDEMIRVLKPMGKLIVTVPINKSLNVDEHLHYFRLYDIYDMFNKYGNNYKIYYLNKTRRRNKNFGEPSLKNIFGIVFINDGDDRNDK